MAKMSHEIGSMDFSKICIWGANNKEYFSVGQIGKLGRLEITFVLRTKN